MIEIEELQEKMAELISEFEAKYEGLEVNVILLGPDEYKLIFKHVYGYEVPSKPDLCDVNKSISSYSKIMSFVSEVAAYGQNKVTNDVIYFKLKGRDIHVINTEIKGFFNVGYIE